MKFNRLAVTAILGACVFFSTAHADVKKGQKLYLKACKECHGNGTKGAAMHSQAEWKKLFENNAKGMVDAHKGTDGENKMSPSFFEKNGEHIFDFLHEYANDSGNVPSC